jgi:hypothetical protein
MPVRTFIDAPASSTKDWPARNIGKTLSPTWLACDIANFWLKVILAESHLAESFSIWLKG